MKMLRVGVGGPRASRDERRACSRAETPCAARAGSSVSRVREVQRRGAVPGPLFRLPVNRDLCRSVVSRHWCVYSSNQGGDVQIWRIATTGGEEQRLTTGYDRIRHISFSPDGRWIYLQSNHQNIYRMPATSGPRQQVTKFPETGLFIEEPKLSPDGRWLACCRNNGGSYLWLLELANSPKPTR
jgi:WD40 repeat protein